MRDLRKLVVESNSDGSYTLFQDMADAWGTVPKGFTYDMASIPRILHSVLPKDDRHYRRASAYHDFGYRYQLGKQRSDMVMDEIAKADGAPMLKRMIVSSGLAVGGWYAYGNHTLAHLARVKGFEAKRFSEPYRSNPYPKRSEQRAWWNWGWMYSRDNPGHDIITGIIPMRTNGLRP